MAGDSDSGCGCTGIIFVLMMFFGVIRYCMKHNDWGALWGFLLVYGPVALFWIIVVIVVLWVASKLFGD